MTGRPNPWAFTDQAAYNVGLAAFTAEAGGMMRVFLVGKSAVPDLAAGMTSFDCPMPSP